MLCFCEYTHRVGSPVLQAVHAAMKALDGAPQALPSFMMQMRKVLQMQQTASLEAKQTLFCVWEWVKGLILLVKTPQRSAKLVKEPGVSCPRQHTVSKECLCRTQRAARPGSGIVSLFHPWKRLNLQL